MYCTNCKGSGMVPPAHFPRSRGGWMDREVIFTGIPCAVCGGSGRVDEAVPSLSARQEILDLQIQIIDEILQDSFLITSIKQAWIDTIGRIDLDSPAQPELAQLLDEVDDYRRDFTDDDNLRNFFLLLHAKLLSLDSKLFNLNLDI